MSNIFFLSREKRYRLINVITFLAAFAGLLLLFYIYLRSDKAFYAQRPETLIITLGMLTFPVVIILMRYLQTGAFFKRNVESISSGETLQYKNVSKIIEQQQNQIVSLKNKINETSEKLSNIKSVYDEISVDQRNKLIDDLKVKIQASATSEFLDEIKNQIISKSERETILEAIDEKCNDSIIRLTHETAALSRRGNLNLVLGILTTITGLIILYIYVSNLIINTSEPLLMLSIFIPRLTLVIFIELFAYFFLKLYKSNLSEIKYFQNELTNIEAKFVSLRTSILKKDEAATNEVIKLLSSTERNFILEKGQSTLDLERYKMDKDASVGALGIVKDLIKKIKIT